MDKHDQILHDILREIVAIRELMVQQTQDGKGNGTALQKRDIKQDSNGGASLESLSTKYGKTIKEIALMLKLKLPFIQVDEHANRDKKNKYIQSKQIKDQNRKNDRKDERTVWSHDETEALLKELKAGKVTPEIAVIHNRSESDVVSRLSNYLSWRLRKGATNDILMDEIGISKDDIMMYA